MHSCLAFAVLAGTYALAYELPSNLQQIYAKHKPGKCSDKLQGGFDDDSFAYCGDISGAIFLHSQRNGGQYDNMDIDCDGSDNKAGGCSNDPTGQSDTAFEDQLKQYGISNLNANIHPYVVFGNDGGDVTFNPQDYGMHPLSVMAVVCNGQVFYGVWGDTNGGVSTGEASLAMGNLCFPNAGLNGNNGHGPNDVLYIGFKGSKAVPGSSADWKASNYHDFEASIEKLGKSLVAGLSA